MSAGDLPRWGDLYGELSTKTESASTPTSSDPIERAADQEELEYESYADSSMTIPAKGEEGPNCQTWGMFQFCDECGEPQPAQSRCERRECPHCGHTVWEPERTTGIVQRLAKGRYAAEDGVDRRAIHAVVSPPTDEEWQSEQITTLVEWFEGYRRAYEIAKQQGIRGGVVIGHGFRVNEETKKRFRELDLDIGIWKWIEEDLPKSWRSHTFWSPHYHVIGLARDLAENKPEQQEGWQCVRIRSLGAFTGTTDRKGCEDMVRAIRYPLSHATFESDSQKDCVRWFGELATTKFQPDEELSPGANSTIERVVNEVVGNPIEAEEEGDAECSEPVEEECVNDECDSTSFSSIFDAGAALMDSTWCEEIGREQQQRLEAAFEWAIGDRKPPPGLKNPQTEAQLTEAFEAIL